MKKITKYAHLGALILFLMHPEYLSACEQAVVLKPVIDLYGEPSAVRTTNVMPYAGGSSEPFKACPRLHQLLYNEVVDIIDQKGDLLYVRAPHLFFIMPHSKIKQSTFWTHKDNIVPFTCLHKKQRDCIPAPRSYNAIIKEPAQKIITLARPWYCSSFDTTFSAGTRLIVASKPQPRDTYKVHALHPATRKPCVFAVPRSLCIIPENNREIVHKQYIELLRSWAHTPGIIPYVWGGCSFVAPLAATDTFHEIAMQAPQSGTAFVYRTHHKQVIDGFDCAGLILRAAQAAGMPYFYKNTTTLVTYLKPIETISELQDGDLIWIDRHVMAVGSIKENMLIEARHYNNGFGKVHEIALNKVFKHIHSYADLFDTIAQHKPLYRLDKNGHTVETIRTAKLLSIDSCWDNAH